MRSDSHVDDFTQLTDDLSQSREESVASSAPVQSANLADVAGQQSPGESPGCTWPRLARDSQDLQVYISEKVQPELE